MTAESASDTPVSERARHIRSFVRREGRLTRAQEQAREILWPRYGLPESGPVDVNGWLQGQGRLCLEIGFGDGQALTESARTRPDDRFIGLEVYAPGVGRLLNAADTLKLDNLRISDSDAVEFLRNRLPAACLDEVMIWFPDPWPKTRHHKRRLINDAFVQLLAGRMQTGSVLRLATDWEHYALQMMEVLSRAPAYENLHGTGIYAPRHPGRPLTKFERRGQALGHPVWDLAFRRTAESLEISTA